MAQSLEQYVSQYTKAYQPAYDAIQAQLDAQPGRLEATTQQINRDYAQQQNTLNRNKNTAAETASMQAAGSGGSFGGAANIANRKYYEQSFVPAQTQLQTNQANALSNARQANEDQRLSLASQLANMKSQATAAATQQYYSDLEAERARQAQAAQQNAYYKYLMEATKNATPTYSLSSTRNQYGGFDWTDSNGNPHTLATVAAAAAGGATSGDAFNNALYQLAKQAANQGDYYSQVLVQQMDNGKRFAKGYPAGTSSNILKTLNLNVTDW